MKGVIGKAGEVQPATVRAELTVGCDRLLVPVEAEVCRECGEAYCSPDARPPLERVRADFSGKAITPSPVRKVYQVS